MNTRKLSNADLDMLSAFTNSLYERVDRVNEDERLFADLTGLYGDIIREISKNGNGKASSIFDYSKLLLEELQLHSGIEAYIIGLENKSMSADDILTGYQLKISDESNRLENLIQLAYNEFSDWLGSSNRLISDFTDIFQSVHGVVKNNLRDFIVLGQSSERAGRI